MYIHIQQGQELKDISKQYIKVIIKANKLHKKRNILYPNC